MKFKTIHVLKMNICIFFVMIFLGCGQNEYKGDGTLDKGFFFYPKFRVTFSEIPINANIKKIYKIIGAPNDELILRFDIVRAEGKRETDFKELTLIWEDLNKAKIELKVDLTIGGSELRSVGPDLLTQSWTLAAFGKEYYIWHKDFNNLILKKDGDYKLNVTINAKGNLRQKVFLIPVLEGGGFGKGDIYRSQ